MAALGLGDLELVFVDRELRATERLGLGEGEGEARRLVGHQPALVDREREDVAAGIASLGDEVQVQAGDPDMGKERRGEEPDERPLAAVEVADGLDRVASTSRVPGSWGVTLLTLIDAKRHSARTA